MTEETGGHVPPAAPEIPRRRRFRKRQVSGLLFLLAFPVVALTGLTDSTATYTAAADTFRATATYPRTTRHLRPGFMDILVTNTGEEPLTQVSVGIDHGYLARAMELSVMPGESSIGNGVLLVELDTVPPGDQRAVRLEYRPGGYWLSSGTVVVEAAGDRAVLPLRTLTLP